MTSRTKMSRVMQGVIPYIAIEGAEKAIAFYTRAFGATQCGESAKGADGRLMNATLEINGGAVMLSDPFCDEAEAGVRGVTMQLVIGDGDTWWNRAVAAGCTVVSPLKPEFWGDRYGRVRDPFGVEWAFNEPGPANMARMEREMADADRD